MTKYEMRVLLFDVDGTLTYPMKSIGNDVVEALQTVKSNGYNLSVVGGSDYNKISNQLEGSLTLFDYICTENGLVTYHNNEIFSNSLMEMLGESAFQDVINTILYELSRIVLPVKRDKFIEVRQACINVSPIGRSCSYDERVDFAAYDSLHKIREKLVNDILPILTRYGLTAVIGGMISIDIYPIGWDKRYSLKFFQNADVIHFFGDKTEPGGNDHAIYTDNRVIGHTVTGPLDLIQQLILLTND